MFIANVQETLIDLGLDIDSLIYSMVAFTYRVFLLLAGSAPFNYSDFELMTKRIYAVIGIVMLFVLTYELFMLIINPDESKKETNPGKIIVNVVLTVVIIVLLPSLFSFITNMQTAFLDNDFLGHLILGTAYVPNNSTVACDSNSNTIKQGGFLMASNVFSAFFYSDDDSIEADKTAICYSDSNGDVTASTLKEANICSSTTGNFSVYKNFSGSVVNNSINFDWLFSAIAGAFLVYVIISFTFDLGIRVVKLAFLQMIAPVPVILRLIPKTKDVFNNWIKMLFSVYLEVFVRIGTMYLGVYFISRFIDKNGNNNSWLINCESNGFIRSLASAFVILGIVAFIKLLPELLKKLFPGMDSGGMKLGLKDKLAASGAFAVGAGVGAMATTGVRNFNANKGKGLGKGFVSALAGAGSGFARGVKGGTSAKNWADMNKAASTATSAATGKRSARAAYKASHGGNIGGVIAGHISDARESINTWAGGSSLDALKQQQAMYDEGTALQSDLFALVDDDKMVMSIVGAKKAEQERVIQKKEIDRGKYGSFQRDGSWKWNGDKAQERYNFDVRNSNLEYANAIQDRTKRLEVLDNAEKLARAKAVDDKLRDGTDGRFIAMQKKSETFQKQHSDDNTISGMAGISVMSDEERTRVDEALSTFDPDKINSTWTGAKSGDIGYVSDNTKFKTESGKVKTAIAEKIEKVQPASSDNKS